MMHWIAVAVGGAVGSLGRHAVNVAFAHRLPAAEPYGTATVNIMGSLAIGVLAGLVAGDRLQLSPEIRIFVFVGLLGGLTTFSSLILDTFTLAENGRTLAAMLNVLLQVIVGYAVAYLGFRLAA